MKNIKKGSLKNCIPIIVIMFIWGVIINPLLSSGFSFKFLKTAKYWGNIVPIIILFPIFIIAIIQNDKG